MPDTLHSLADRARGGDAQARQCLREELARELLPLVRCALRRGAGLPGLVSWVRGRFAELADTAEPPNEREATPVLVRLLCAGVVKNLSEVNLRRTIAGQ